MFEGPALQVEGTVSTKPGVRSKYTSVFKIYKENALAGMAQWIEHWPANQRVTHLVPSQGTHLGYRTGPQWKARERQPHIDVSLHLFLLPFPSV